MRFAAIAVLLGVSACASTPPATVHRQGPVQAGVPDLEPPSNSRASREDVARHAVRARIVATSAPLQCVPYARRQTGIAIKGDAWTWWRSAESLYRRGQRPVPLSVLVMDRTQRLRYGHLAVVTKILSSREILVDQANWLNQGRIHRNVPVVDVSPNNDWSEVRVWYTPGNSLGVRRYRVSGFIYPFRT